MIILNSPSSVNPFRQTFFVPADCLISDGSIPIFSIGFRAVFSVRHPNKRKPPHRDCAAVLMINVQQRKKSELDLLCDISSNFLDLDALLLHSVAVTNGYAAVLLSLEIDGYAVRCTDLVLTAIALTDRACIVKINREPAPFNL